MPSRTYILVRLVCSSLLVAMLGMGFFAKRGWLDWRRVVEQNEEVRLKIAEATLKRDRMESQITSVGTHLEQQEILVRQTLGYVAPGEIVVEFP